jgi:hypothetical protein
MHCFQADPASSTPWHGFLPALTRFADDLCATLARLIAYGCALALLGILLIHGWDQWRAWTVAGPVARAGWNVADRSHPAFALSRPDTVDKSLSYVIIRHPAGGRKDVLRWGGDHPVAELEIYRAGDEFDPNTAPLNATARADLAVRMGLTSPSDLEAGGLVESKFGPVAVLRRVGAPERRGDCLGFFRTIDDPGVRISGWTCQGDSLPARRAEVACVLNRLILLTAASEPGVSESFARAELRRGSGCAMAPGAAESGGWIGGPENPGLRGAL